MGYNNKQSGGYNNRPPAVPAPPQPADADCTLRSAQGARSTRQSSNAKTEAVEDFYYYEDFIIY